MTNEIKTHQRIAEEADRFILEGVDDLDQCLADDQDVLSEVFWRLERTVED